MIINTGMWTYIPAFHSDLLMDKIRDGYVLVRNPYRPDWVTRYELSPDIVDCLAFCTKNSAPMLRYIDKLKRFHQYWFVTITPYDKDIEPNVPPKEQVMQDFAVLSGRIALRGVTIRFLLTTYIPLNAIYPTLRPCAGLFPVILMFALSALLIFMRK